MSATKFHTHTKQDTNYTHVIIIALPRQQWLRERASALHSYVLLLSCKWSNASITKYILCHHPTITFSGNESITCYLHMNYYIFIFKQMALSKRNIYHTAVLSSAGRNHHCYCSAFLSPASFKCKYEWL